MSARAGVIQLAKSVLELRESVTNIHNAHNTHIYVYYNIKCDDAILKYYVSEKIFIGICKGM